MPKQTFLEGGGRKLFYRWIIASILVGSLIVVWQANREPRDPCDSRLTMHPGERRFVPLQVVAQPWKGRHHVYGVFEIPVEYRVHRLYSVRLTIGGEETVFAAGSPENEEFTETPSIEGVFIRRAYVPTRTAVWFLLTGRFGNLNSVCHWSLIYTNLYANPIE